MTTPCSCQRQPLATVQKSALLLGSSVFLQNPKTPKALADIANGADVADTLDAAVDEINADIEKNGGYGH